MLQYKIIQLYLVIYFQFLTYLRRYSMEPISSPKQLILSAVLSYAFTVDAHKLYVETILQFTP